MSAVEPPCRARLEPLLTKAVPMAAYAQAHLDHRCADCGRFFADRERVMYDPDIIGARCLDHTICSSSSTSVKLSPSKSIIGKLTPKGEETMPYDMPATTSFTPHPEGRYTGQITDIKDEGKHKIKDEGKRKISVWITSDRLMDAGQPFLLVEWFTLSSSEQAKLTAFRAAVLDRPLTEAEVAFFDERAELMSKRISFRVDHKIKADGTPRANIRPGSVEPAEGSTQQLKPQAVYDEVDQGKLFDMPATPQQTENPYA